MRALGSALRFGRTAMDFCQPTVERERPAALLGGGFPTPPPPLTGTLVKS